MSLIPIYKPYLPKRALKYAHDALDSTWISSHGKYIDMAQERLGELLGVKHVVLTANGTCACHLASCALANKINRYGKKDVLIGGNNYIACYNSLLIDKEFRLITVKTDLDTWNIDLNDLDAKIDQYPHAAVSIVHNISSTIDIPALKRKYPNTIFIEDACEAFTGRHNGTYTGTASYVGVLSFFGNKNITTGEGGALLTQDSQVYEEIEHICNQGQVEKRFRHDRLGYNYRMTNICASLLVGQLEVLPEILEKKASIFCKYRAAFKDRKDVKIQLNPTGCEPSNWMMGIAVPGSKYDEAEAFLKSRNIEARQMFFHISEHKYLVDNDDVLIGEDDVAKRLNSECIIIPSYPGLKDEEVAHIIECIEEYLKANG